MKLKLTAIVLPIAASVLLAGCGSSTDTGNSAGSTTANSSSSSSTSTATTVSASAKSLVLEQSDVTAVTGADYGAGTGQPLNPTSSASASPAAATPQVDAYQVVFSKGTDPATQSRVVSQAIVVADSTTAKSVLQGTQIGVTDKGGKVLGDVQIGDEGHVSTLTTQGAILFVVSWRDRNVVGEVLINSPDGTLTQASAEALAQKEEARIKAAA